MQSQELTIMSLENVVRELFPLYIVLLRHVLYQTLTYHLRKLGEVIFIVSFLAKKPLTASH